MLDILCILVPLECYLLGNNGVLMLLVSLRLVLFLLLPSFEYVWSQSSLLLHAALVRVALLLESRLLHGRWSQGGRTLT